MKDVIDTEDCPATQNSPIYDGTRVGRVVSVGGAPPEHRSNSLSAIFRNLDRKTREDLTQRYDALCAHYEMDPIRSNRGVAHEKGAIESPRGHPKKGVKHALLMRGANDFEDLTSYTNGTKCRPVTAGISTSWRARPGHPYKHLPR